MEIIREDIGSDAEKASASQKERMVRGVRMTKRTELHTHSRRFVIAIAAQFQLEIKNLHHSIDAMQCNVHSSSR